MLNSKAISNLLSKNSDERLCKRWFLMTPNGTLLAYSQPTDIRDLRRQAAMAAISWQEHQELQQRSHVTVDPETSQQITMPSLLQTLTLETGTANLILRKLQPQLLLVLEGGVRPRHRVFDTKVTPENASDSPYPAPQQINKDTMVASSASSQTERGSASVGVLALQRRKLDAMAAAIAQDLEKTGFKMPEEGSTQLF